MKIHFLRSALHVVITFMLLESNSVFALNYFELEVYPYATASRGEVEIENLTAYTSRGRDDASSPDNHQGLTRSTFELIYGVTDKIEVAYYRDYARPRGGNFDHAASRYRARARFLEKGELPVDLGFYVEFEFPRGEEDDAEMELRGILEKDIGRWTLDVNPMLERVLSGPGREEGWELQYAAALIYRADARWQPRLDLFGDFGPLRNFEPYSKQKHLLSPAIDFRLGHRFFAGFGLGFGLTDATEQRLVRAHLEWEF